MAGACAEAAPSGTASSAPGGGALAGPTVSAGGNEGSSCSQTRGSNEPVTGSIHTS